MTPNEARILEDRDTIDGGDFLSGPANGAIFDPVTVSFSSPDRSLHRKLILMTPTRMHKATKIKQRPKALVPTPAAMGMVIRLRLRPPNLLSPRNRVRQRRGSQLWLTQRLNASCAKRVRAVPTPGSSPSCYTSMLLTLKHTSPAAKN